MTVINIELGNIGANFLNDNFFRLKNLTLINCNIFSFDSNAFYLSDNEIKYLRIEGNKRLRNIHGSVFRYMTELETINLSNNSNTYFEFNCNQLNKLNTLILDYNHVHAINSLVSSTCNSLQTVQIKNSEIVSIHQNILNEMPKLIHLNLHGNKLQNLNFISPHNSLSFLNLSANYIVQFNISILSSLTNLTVLDLSNNEIQFESFVQQNVTLNKIKTLILYNNEMVNLTSLTAFPNVENLDLSSLNIEIISENVFKSLDKLNTLNVNRNNFQFLACESFSNNNNLQYLNLSRNDLNKTILECSDLFKNLPKLIDLDLSHCQIYNSINDTLFANLVNLKQIKLKNNNISVISCTLFQNNILLDSLSLSYNNLENIPTCTFKTLLKLRKLDLSHNLIFELPIGIFSAVNDLQYLDISYNKLHSLDEAILHPLSKLNALDISANNIENLDADKLLSNLDDLHEIDLSGNPWLCNNLIRIKNTLKSARITIRSKIIDLENNNINGIHCRQDEKPTVANNNNNQILEELKKLNLEAKTDFQEILKELRKSAIENSDSLTRTINSKSEISLNKNIALNVNRIYYVILISVILFILYKVFSIGYKKLYEKKIKDMLNKRTSNSTVTELLSEF